MESYIPCNALTPSPYQLLFLRFYPDCNLFFNTSINVCNLDSSPVVDTSNNATGLWHYRLGHPSSQRLALLKSIVPDLSSSNNNNTFDCHICPLAKQHKLPFPKSTSVSLAFFDLIHADIWGPYSAPYFG